jgi:hypothetical protein
MEIDLGDARDTLDEAEAALRNVSHDDAALALAAERNELDVDGALVFGAFVGEQHERDRVALVHVEPRNGVAVKRNTLARRRRRRRSSSRRRRVVGDHIDEAARAAAVLLLLVLVVVVVVVVATHARQSTRADAGEPLGGAMLKDDGAGRQELNADGARLGLVVPRDGGDEKRDLLADARLGQLAERKEEVVGAIQTANESKRRLDGAHHAELAVATSVHLFATLMMMMMMLTRLMLSFRIAIDRMTI